MPEPSSTPEDTRKRILSAAAEIFAENGYTRTTTRAIAEAAEVNEVTLFRHFGSKRTLLSEMIQEHSALPDLTTLIENQLSSDYRQDLIQLATVFFQTITARKEALRLMLCEARELPEIREVVVKVPDQLRQVLTRYFQARIETGDLRGMNPEVMAQGFLGMFFSYGIAREMLDSAIAPEVPQEALITQFVDIFIQGTINPP
jgi:AcrR family transcriptional regulator